MCEANDDDLCIPRSAMYKLVKELVPQVRLSGEAKDLIVTCCNEFIHLLAAEANNVCEKQSKKLILPDHVLLALDNLGFSEYRQDCLEVMKQMQEETDKRKKFHNRLDKSGVPEEELLRQQSELFAEARKQQELLDNADEWSKMQQAAQEALQRQTSMTSSNQTSSLITTPTASHLNNYNNGNVNLNSTKIEVSNINGHNSNNNNHNNNNNIVDNNGNKNGADDDDNYD